MCWATADIIVNLLQSHCVDIMKESWNVVINMRISTN